MLFAAIRDIAPTILESTEMATPQKFYLFKKDKYMQIDGPTGKIDLPPTPIDDGVSTNTSNWTGLKAAGFASDIDAAVYFNNVLVFFKGNRYAVFDGMSKTWTLSGPISDTVTAGPNDGPAFATQLPNDANGDFTQNVEAAVWNAGYVYLFKGAYLVRAVAPTSMMVGLANFAKASSLITANWGTIYPFGMGINAACALHGLMEDWLFCRGDSWTTYTMRQGQTLECLWPGVRDYGFNEDLDAIVLVPWILNPPETEPVDD
jgi:hypothetical protein